MTAESTPWRIRLDAPPALHQIGVGVHGGQPVERHCLRRLWSIHLYSYHAELRMDGEQIAIRPGVLTVTPPDTVLEYRFPRQHCPHVYAHFSTDRRGTAISVPKAQLLDSANFDRLRGLLEQAVGWWSTSPARAEARLWDVLWQVASSTHDDASRQGAQAFHPLFRKATERIEHRLSERIDIAALSEELEVSHNHLNRLFATAAGMTIGQFIRQRRAARAFHLLTQTTLPTKAVAREVGLPDLQSLNKLVRRAFGKPPRRLKMGTSKADHAS